MTLAAMLLVANVVMAQDTKACRQMPSKADMAKHRTEMMAKKYNLDDKQKAKLLELNTKYADQFGPMRGRRPGAQPQGCCKKQEQGCANCAKAKANEEKDCCKAQKADCKQAKAQKRPELTEEQKTEMQKRRQEMQTKREAYVNELKSILNEEQLKQFNSDCQNKQDRQRCNQK